MTKHLGKESETAGRFDPDWEKENNQKAIYLGAIKGCGNGAISAFAIIKDLEPKYLIANFGIGAARLEEWREKYKELSKQTGNKGESQSA